MARAAAMQKQKEYDWKDSNLALFGSPLEKNIKAAAAEGEDAWAEVGCPLPRLKRTGHPQDRKIRDFAEIISAFLATPSPLIRQNLRFRRNFVKHFSIP